MASKNQVPTAVDKGIFSFARPNASEPERLAILSAAADAFFEFGFNNTSVDEIADRLGASKGQVYHYYRSKSDILFDIQQSATEAYLAAVTPIAKSTHPSDKRLWLMAREHALFTIRNVAFARVALFSTKFPNYRTDSQRRAHTEISKRRREYENLFVTTITEGIKDGSFRNVEPILANKVLLGALNWLAYWYSPGNDTPERQDAIAIEVANFVVSGFAASARLPLQVDEEYPVSNDSTLSAS
jgi:AcrR family transcriptional regulator